MPIDFTSYTSEVRATERIIARDTELLQQRQEKRSAMSYAFPLVGDVVRIPDGTWRRVAHNWNNETIQLTYGPGWDSSFHFGEGGFCSFSGSLSLGIDIEHFKVTEETALAPVWFFSGNLAGAHRGCYCSAVFKVWACDVMPR